MVERGGLENRCALARTVGSNPTPSANFYLLRACAKSRFANILITSGLQIPGYVFFVFSSTIA